MNELSTVVTELPIAAVRIREDLYPRLKKNPAKIEEYALAVELLPPVEVNQDHILIDGFHRLKAHETAKHDTVPVRVTRTRSENEIFLLAIERNARHGLILSQEDKRRLAVRFCLSGFDAREVCAALSIPERTYHEWTVGARAQRAEGQRQTILDLHLRCYTQEQIAGRVEVPRETVRDEIAGFGESGSFADSAIFHDFEADDSEASGRRVYDVWNFAKAADNEVRHFGNIPPRF